MQFDRRHYPDHTLGELYLGLLKPRLFEERMLMLLKQGRISKWFSGIGQEAVSVGAAMAMAGDEYILPAHRNLGVFTTRKVPYKRLLAQFRGKSDGYTRGRDRSFHFDAPEQKIVGMISHLGAQLSVADGIGLAHLLSGEKKAVLTFTGEGGTSEGEFHEAMNLAAVWNLPVIFLVENNGYGLSTPLSEQFRIKSFAEKGPAYGIETKVIDGNNVLEVYHTVKEIAEDIRKNPRPVLIEAITFRMRGHEESSGTKYIPAELFEKWSRLDPLTNYENFLIENELLSTDTIARYREQIKQDVNEEIEKSLAEHDADPAPGREEESVFAPFDQKIHNPISGYQQDTRFVDAIRAALTESMEKYPELLLMGQDICEMGGVFKVTEGLWEKFGKDRVRNTPLCESAIVGAALGLSLKGKKSVIEMQYADFVSGAMTQLVNNIAKSHYRRNKAADVVVRMPTGAGTGGGPFHSQSNEAWFFHTPGLKIVYPSNAYDAKGLLNAAIEDPNPYLYFEHKLLYRSHSAPVPDGYYTVPVGKAHVAREGSLLTIVTYGMGVKMSIEATEELGIDAEVIDLRTLIPWDKAAVAASVEKTGKLLVVHEDTLTGGIGAEIAAWAAEHLFSYLDAPIMREAALDTPVPFAHSLETDFLPWQRLPDKIKTLANF